MMEVESKFGTAAPVGAVTVIGGGIGGVQSALDLAEMGFKVYLVEEKSSVGGIMAQLDKTFPTNDCAMCLLSPKLVDVGRHPNIEIITTAEVDKVTGHPGMFVVDLTKKPRYVNEQKCTGCGDCANACPVRYKPVFKKKTKPVEIGHEQLIELNRIIDRYKPEKGALIPVLQEINRRYHYVPKEALKVASQEMEVPLSQIYSLATFYKSFRLEPVGEHLITVCMGTACHVKGAPLIVEKFQRDLEVETGKTTRDQKFTLETVHCLGCCALAPVVVVDGEYCGGMTASKVDAILKKYGV